jgi:hypothetical protein
MVIGSGLPDRIVNILEKNKIINVEKIVGLNLTIFSFIMPKKLLFLSLFLNMIEKMVVKTK